LKRFIDVAGDWRRLVGFAFVAVALAFLAIFLLANLRELEQHEWSVRPGLLALSFGIQIIGLTSGALAWQILLRGMGTSVPFIPLARVRFVSGLARFIPGKIWPFLGAARLASSFDIPAAVTITSLAAHTVFSIIGALIISAYFLPLAALPSLRLELLRWLAPLLLLFAHPRVIRMALEMISKLTRRQIAAWTASWLQGIGLVAIAVVGWIITGVALCAFILSLTPITAAAFPAVIGVNAFAFVLGQAFFITPAGLGAKEGTTAALLALYVSVPVAAVLAVGVRLWTTVAEVVIAFVLMHWPTNDG
jgi:glycosyltransferase 2 family protein